MDADQKPKTRFEVLTREKNLLCPRRIQLHFYPRVSAQSRGKGLLPRFGMLRGGGAGRQGIFAIDHIL
jgi:hypothetical protein